MDRLTPERRSENMRRIKSKDMKPELAVRRLVHALGYRFRLHRSGLPGKPDLVFAGRRKAIFVHGCFWHQHAEAGCKLVRKPSSNTSYWGPKLERTIARDKANEAALAAAGWQVLTLWECGLRDADALAEQLKDFLGARGSSAVL